MEIIRSIRKIISQLPEIFKILFSDFFALFVYYPVARILFILDKLNLDVRNIPLNYYKNLSFYTMRTDSRDRFGTSLEKRYTKKQIFNMLHKAGLHRIKFSQKTHLYWCAVGFKKIIDENTKIYIPCLLPYPNDTVPGQRFRWEQWENLLKKYFFKENIFF